MSERQDGWYWVRTWARIFDNYNTAWRPAYWRNGLWSGGAGAAMEPHERDIVGPRISMPDDPPAPQAAVDLEPLKALCDAATPGDWSVEKFTLVVSHSRQQRVADVAGHSAEERAANARFIAAARTAMPALIHELESLRARVAELESE